VSPVLYEVSKCEETFRLSDYMFIIY